MKRIGIIGGMGPLATCDLYQKITLNTQAASDQEQVPVIIDSNTAIADRTAFILNGGEDPLPQMKASVDRLVGAGADFLIMPCNTAHYFYDELTACTSLPLLHMLRLTAETAAEKAEMTRKAGKDKIIGLLATDGTLRSGIYDQVFSEMDVTLVKPAAHQHKVMDFIYEGVKKNNLSVGTEGLFSAVNEMKAQGASTFILGCTELSAAAAYCDFDDTFVDPLLVLARASIEFAGGRLIGSSSD